MTTPQEVIAAAIVEELRNQTRKIGVAGTIKNLVSEGPDGGTDRVVIEGVWNLDKVGEALLDEGHLVEAPEWRCFFCDEVFTDRTAAALHFGVDEDCDPACRIKGAEGGLVRALRDAEAQAASVMAQLHAESTDTHRAYAQMQHRHLGAVASAEQVGYDKGLRDMRQQVEVLSRALLWRGDPVRLARTREDWQQTVDEAVRFVRDHPEEGMPSIPAGATLMADGMTYMVRHNPNCPAPFEARMTRTVIDMLPPADSRDAIGYGASFEDAVLEAMGALATQRGQA